MRSKRRRRRRTRDLHAEIFGRGHRAIVDGRAGCCGGRAVDVGRTEVDVDLFDQFRIELLVRIDGIVARVVERNAVEGQADAVGRKAADGQLTARRTISVIVGEDDARDQVDGVENGLTGVLTRDHFLTQNRLRLRRIGRLDAGDVLRRGAGDDDFVFEIDRARRLGKGRRGKQRKRKQRGASGERVSEIHDRLSP